MPKTLEGIEEIYQKPRAAKLLTATDKATGQIPTVQKYRKKKTEQDISKHTKV